MKLERALWAALAGAFAFLYIEAREWHTEVVLATNNAARELPDAEAAKFWRDVIDEYRRQSHR